MFPRTKALRSILDKLCLLTLSGQDEGVSPMPEPAQVFEDRVCPGEWRVEWVDDDGGIEVAIFAGPKARERALRYADQQYERFEEVSFDP
jgi:hypothetical protein